MTTDEGRERERQSFTFHGIPHPKKRAFLAALAECGNIRIACESAKIDRKTYYNWLDEDDVFKEGALAARDHASDLLEQEAWRRAREGTDKPVYQGGGLVGTVREYSDTLLIFLLKGNRPDKFHERHELTGKGGGPIKTEERRVWDLTGLTDAELDQLEAIQGKLDSRKVGTK
jgi:hypothetical protein